MRSILHLLLLVVGCAPSQAQDLGVELRAGPALHSLEFNLPSLVNPFHTGRVEDIAVELIYTPSVDLSLLGSPRLALGGTFSLRGMEHMVHANLNWHVPVFNTAVYLEGGLGASYVTGYLHSPPAGYRRLGCHPMFYFQTAAGVDLPEGWTATLAWEHSSHAWLCGPDNESLNSLSLKVGHRF
jgi:lipid A 3-O-deacylase